MKIVLLDDVAKLGKRYEVKEVSDGFALNNLIPKGKAKTATASVLKEIENLQQAELARKKVRDDLLLKNIEDVKGVTVTLERKANEKGALFAGIHAEELVEPLKEQSGLGLEAEHIMLDDPLKTVGEHEVVAKVGDIEAAFTVKIEAK